MLSLSTRRVLFAAVVVVSVAISAAAMGRQKPGVEATVNKLDEVIQERFQMDIPAFGVGRVIPVVNGHPDVNWMQRFTKPQQAKIEEIKRSQDMVLVGFLHVGHATGRLASTRQVPEVPRRGKSVWHAPTLQPLPLQILATTGPQPDPIFAKISPRVSDSLPDLLRGKNVQLKVDRTLVYARPILAKQPKCLKCHEGGQLNSTLGVMVYVAKPAVLKSR